MSVYKKLLELTEEARYIQKTGYNNHHKYSYMTEEDILDKLRPKMVELGLVFYLSRVSIEDNSGSLWTVRCDYLLVDTDSDGGELGRNLIEISVVAQGSDTQDKALYKAMTGARKYALRQLVMISTGDDPERDEDSLELVAKNPKAPYLIRRLMSSGMISDVNLENDAGYGVLSKAIGKPILSLGTDAKSEAILKGVYEFAVAYENLEDRGDINDLLDRLSEIAKG